MESYRRIYEQLPAEIPIPQELQHRRVEVILQPLEPASGPRRNGSQTEWPDGFFAKTEGAWVGEPLTRPPQGELDPRDELT